ncbi:hypothetical protein C0993_003710 [Termitomyces sp. T159_Od127]|nr:hypothetical protein C0993_003710 [Termitomyces sp. T159_Od127]
MVLAAQDPAGYHHRRSSCDELLANTTQPSSGTDSTFDYGFVGTSHDGTTDEAEDSTPTALLQEQPAPSRRRAFFIRTLALLCTCSLSVGSHYASYILGPLKSRLAREIGTSHTDFGLLIAAFSLNSTWTPLFGGLLASRLGTTLTSILATGVIFVGQLLLLLGDICENVRLMVLGLFIFGLGVSPLAVVQETIIVRFFKSHGLGVSMAFGLIAGKGASFIAARTSYPLTECCGPRAPFYAATLLAAISVVINLIYITASKWLIDGAGAELEATDIAEEAQTRLVANVSEAQALQKVAEKRKVSARYIGLNVLCGMMWSPFTHLAANIIETRYNMRERDAATQASYLLAGSLILYPACGYLVDRFKHRSVIVRLLLTSSCLTLLSYLWLVLPPTWTRIPAPAIALFAIGHGFSPLLLVVLVPKIVPLKYVSTALGAHKSLEQTGSTIFQTLAGLALDARKKGDRKTSKAALQHFLNVFVAVNVVQLFSILGLAGLQKEKARAMIQKRSHSTPQENQGLMSGSELRTSYMGGRHRESSIISKSEIRRGVIFALLSVSLILMAWILFLGTAWFRLGREGGHN